MRDLIFRKADAPEYMRLPDSRAGAMSCLTGIADPEQHRPEENHQDRRPRQAVMPPRSAGCPTAPTIGLFTLTNARGLEVRAITYGAIIVSVRVPDRRGRLADVVLGFDDLRATSTRSRYFGAVVGRYGNRIANGRFTLDGRTLSSSPPTTARTTCTAASRASTRWCGRRSRARATAGRAVAFSYTSRDGEEAYPGTLNATRVVHADRRNELVVEYEATTDKPTPVNLTQHSYFNLAGEGHGDILEHVLALDADRFTPVDETMIPTGELAPVGGTPFDFRQPTAIGARIDADARATAARRGYDHNFVLQRRVRRPAPRGARRRAIERTDARSRDDRARRAVLFRQPPERPAGQRRPRLRPAQRLLPRDAALPRLAEPAALPVDDSAARSDLSIEDGVHVWCPAMKRTLTLAVAVLLVAAGRHAQRASAASDPSVDQLRRRDARAAERQRRVVVVHGSARDRERRQADHRVGPRRRQQRGQLSDPRWGNVEISVYDLENGTIEERRAPSAPRTGRSQRAGVLRQARRPLPRRLQQARERAADVLPHLRAAQPARVGPGDGGRKRPETRRRGPATTPPTRTCSGCRTAASTTSSARSTTIRTTCSRTTTARRGSTAGAGSTARAATVRT